MTEQHDPIATYQQVVIPIAPVTDVLREHTAGLRQPYLPTFRCTCGAEFLYVDTHREHVARLIIAAIIDQQQGPTP